MNTFLVLDEVEPRSSNGQRDVYYGFEDAVGQLVGLQEFEHVFHRVELGAVGWQEVQGDVVRDLQVFGLVPSRAIEDDHGVAAACDLLADVLQVSVHFGRVRSFADMPHGPLSSRASGREEVAISEAPIAGDPGSCALASPDPGEHSLLADSALVLHPDLDWPRCVARRFLCQLAEFVAELVLRPKLGLRVQWTRRHLPETLPPQKLAHAFQRVAHAKGFQDPLPDVAQAQAGGGIRLRCRTGLNLCAKLVKLTLVKTAGPTGGIRRPSGPSHLYRSIQSRSVWTSTPCASAASQRRAPRITIATDR